MNTNKNNMKTQESLSVWPLTLFVFICVHSWLVFFLSFATQGVCRGALDFTILDHWLDVARELFHGLPPHSHLPHPPLQHRALALYANVKKC
jgi:hypothetical protein